jgi:hypothetical protein
MHFTRVGFSTSTHLVSTIIRAVTRSKVSHAWLVYYDQDFERDMVLEASAHGFRLVPLDVFARSNTVLAVHDLGRTLHQGLRSLSAWLGSRYDGLGLMGMAWVMFGKWLRCRWKNPFRSTNTMFCTEAIVRALQADGYPGAEALDPEGTTPAELLVFLGEPRL